MIITTTHGPIEDTDMYLNTEKVDNDDELSNVVEYWLLTSDRCEDHQHDVSVEQADGRWAERVHRSARVIKKMGSLAGSVAGAFN